MAEDSLVRGSDGNTNSQLPSQRTYQVVVAATRDMGIGKCGQLPWRLPSDLKFFKEITTATSDPGKKNAIVMGKKTWESIPSKLRPLPGRINVVLTRSRSLNVARNENVIICGDLQSALKLEALNAPKCDAIHLTEIETSFEGDTFIPPVDLSVYKPWFYRRKISIYGWQCIQRIPGHCWPNGQGSGDLGPIYGFQWRHFGAKYNNMRADYTGHGFDQLLDVIGKIKNKPDDRHIILSAWNPSDLELMALPPCLMFAQFYVANGELSCQMYQQSADMGLGLPFNIASYALLTFMIAHVCHLFPGDFIHVLGDANVYKNHVDALQEQLQKHPKPFPILKINPQKKEIYSFVAADFYLIGYNPHQKIEMKMAV